MRPLAPSALLAALALAAPPARAGVLVAQAPAAPAAPSAAPSAAPEPARTPSVATSAKLAEGDRLLAAGDAKNALFAYLDALYAQPTLASTRVKVGRAYLAARYPGRAAEQAEQALAADASDPEAQKLLEEARAAAARTGQPLSATGSSAAALAGGAVAVAVAAPAPRPAAAPKVFKLAPEPAAPAAPEKTVAVADGSGVEHYKTALGFLQGREWAKAVSELTLAVQADPKLAVAWSARGSAQFGLGKYREAADDYAQAIALDPKLGTPIYGLAEAQRQLGDKKAAAESYQRYVDSSAPDVRDDLKALAARRAAELR